MTSGLGEAFGGSARGGHQDLSGLLPPRPAPTAPAPEPDAEESAAPDPPGDQQTPPAPPEPRKPAKTARPARRASTPPPEPAGAEDTDVTYPVSVYVLARVRRVAEKRRKETGVTNARIAFDAIDGCQHRLAGLIQARRTTPRAENSLFPSRVTRRPDPGVTEQRRVLYQMRATAAEITVLDRLTEEAGAESRSELVSVALEAALLPPRR